MSTYRYDRNYYSCGDESRIEISHEFADTACVQLINDGETLTIGIRGEDVVEVAEQLCKHAGRDVIILDRPDEAARLDGYQPGDVMFKLSDHSELAIVCGDCGTREYHQPAKAHELAAWIAALVDRAESEPDPDEVHELAKYLHQGESALDGPDSYAAARTVLRAGYKREVT